MIGEMIGELTGKVVNQRIVHHYGSDLKIEKTMESKGKILGEEVTLLATFWMKERLQGGTYSMGHGILMTKTGGKIIAKGAGISVPGPGPGIHMRGSRYMQTDIPGLSRLNNVVALFEIEVAPDGTVKDKMWEWK
jgi:hypothetical protein